MDSLDRLVAPVGDFAATGLDGKGDGAWPTGGAAPARVGLVIGQLTTGGAEGQLLELARRAPEFGFLPTVYSLSEKTEPYGRKLEEAGVPLRVIGGRGTRRLSRLLRALRADRVEILHAWLFIANTYAWLAAKALRLPFLATARNCKLQGRLHTAANRLALRTAARVIANSEEVARFVEQHYGTPAGRTCVIYNGVDTDRFRPLGTSGEGAPLVVGAGRLVPQKDPLCFVRVARDIGQRIPSARFVFAGDGPLREAVIREIRAQGLDNRFSLPGECRDMPTLLGSASLFLLTSAWEGLPNVVLEAMACAVPVVATDVGGTRELLRSGQEGFLVSRGDVGAMAHYAAELLADETRRREFAARARQRAEQFRLDTMARSTCAAYREVLRQAARAAAAR